MLRLYPRKKLAKVKNIPNFKNVTTTTIFR